MAKFSVCIPYTEGSDTRQRLFRWVHDRWQETYPGCPIVLGRDLGYERGLADNFSRAKARNDAVRQATTDIVILADADTVFDREGIEEGLQRLRTGAAWVLPYGAKGYYNLTQEYTTSVLRRNPSDPLADIEWEHQLTSWAGLVMVRRADFWAVGGYDITFDGWGWEDNAFRLSMERKIGPLVRTEGFRALHLWHERDGLEFGTPTEIRNRHYYNKTYHNKDDVKVRH